MPHFAAWYRREDYQRIRKIMDDGDNLPSDFDEWETVAQGQVASAAVSGIIIKPIILDPDDFIAQGGENLMRQSGPRQICH